MIALLLLSLAVPRLFFGDPATPVAFGEIWIVANRWGAYPAVLAATIRDGVVQEVSPLRYPHYWEQAPTSGS